MSNKLPDDWMERGVRALNALGHGPQDTPPKPEPPADHGWNVGEQQK